MFDVQRLPDSGWHAAVREADGDGDQPLATAITCRSSDRLHNLNEFGATIGQHFDCWTEGMGTCPC